VVLTDAKEVDPHLVGEDPLFDEVADRLGMGDRAVVFVVGDVAESVEPEDQREARALRGFDCGVRRCCGHLKPLCLFLLGGDGML